MCLTLERGGSHWTCLESRGRSLGGTADEARKMNLRIKRDTIKVDQCPSANLLLEHRL